MFMGQMVRFGSIGMMLCGLLFLSGTVQAEPSKGQVIKMWQGQYKNATVLDIVPRGGQRTTNQLHNKHYIGPVGTCWDYDVTELQKCGCRLFQKASVCCRKGSSTDCEIRIGASRLVDCSKYGKPKYGLSGNTEPKECRESRTATDCFKRKDLTFGPGSSAGPCMGTPYFVCPGKDETMRNFWDGKCGPTIEDCGCTMVPECSKEEHIACYNEWKNDKMAVDCFSNPKYNNNYKRHKCYEDLKAGKR